MSKDVWPRKCSYRQQLCWNMAGPRRDSSMFVHELDCRKSHMTAQCESVAHHTGAPVLRHKSFKPAYSCITAIRGYFASLRLPIRDEELIVVGDRVFTDVVMANRMRGRRKSLKAPNISSKEETQSENSQSRGPLAVWTTGVWEKEAMPMRWCEKTLVDVVHRWTRAKDAVDFDATRFVKEIIQPEPSRKEGMMAGLFGRLKRG